MQTKNSKWQLICEGNKLAFLTFWNTHFCILSSFVCLWNCILWHHDEKFKNNLTFLGMGVI